MPNKTIKEVYTDLGGNRTVEYSDGSTREYNLQSTIISFSNELTGSVEMMDLDGNTLSSISNTSDGVGPQGLKGDTGLTGKDGKDGTVGIQGADGVAGTNGIIGVNGERGIQGTAGVDGADGTSVSLKGAVDTFSTLPLTLNSEGDLYVVLADGNGYVWSGTVWTNVGPIRGPVGPQGIQGITGVKGDTGIQGIQGAVGSTGNEGTQGVSGTNGTSVSLKGSVATFAVLPSTLNTAGDLYVVLLDGNGYVWSGTIWTNVGPIRGPSGVDGMQGIQGLIGLTGAASLIAGPQGIQGITGTTGNTGLTGNTGETGTQGVQGVQGLTGDQGIQGTVGTDGIDGIQGLTGPAGTDGIDGVAGAQGIQGIQGATGEVNPALLTAEITRANTAEALLAPKLNPIFTGTVQGITSTMVGAPSGSGTSSGENTGDETLSTIKTKLGVTTLSGSNTGDQVLPTLLSLGATPQVLTTSGDIAYMGADGVMQRLPASVIDNQTLTNHPNGTLSWQAAIPGQNATVNIGTITTVASGSNANVTNSGDSLNATLNFSLPQGPAGIAGLAGSNSLLIAPFERWYISAATRVALEVLQINIKTSSVWKFTNPSVGSFSINLRGDAGTTLSSLLSVGDSCTIVIANTCGSVPYFPSSFSIDGVQVFPKWSGGLSPNAGNSNSVDFYAYVISKESSSTYSIYANQTKFA